MSNVTQRDPHKWIGWRFIVFIIILLFMFGYLVSGVAVYGLIGRGLDQWWDTSFMVAIGIVAGAGLGIYMTMKALSVPSASDDHKN